MAPKKKPEPDVSHIEVESEIAELAGENETSEDKTWRNIRSMFHEFFQQSDLRQNQLLSSLSNTVQQSNKSLLAAIDKVVATTKDPQPPKDKACPSQSPTYKESGLFSPSPIEDDEKNWEEMEDFSSDEELDFDGFSSFPPSGQSSPPTQGPQDIDQPSTSRQPDQAADKSALIDEDLFNAYRLAANWPLVPELLHWVQGICNQEFPPETLKELDAMFVPQPEIQALFVAPALPEAITKKLFTAPKAQTRVPRIINGNLLKAQKELCVSYKPLLEVLNFFYSEESDFIVETIPQLYKQLTRLKYLLSQGLAVVMSAGLKISKARQQSLRPLLNYYATSILDQNPTSAHVLGSNDLASLSDKATKERKAMSGVFRSSASNRVRFRTNRYKQFNRSYRQYNSRFNPQTQDYKKGFNRARSKARPRSRQNKSGDKYNSPCW